MSHPRKTHLLILALSASSLVACELPTESLSEPIAESSGDTGVDPGGTAGDGGGVTSGTGMAPDTLNPTTNGGETGTDVTTAATLDPDTSTTSGGEADTTDIGTTAPATSDPDTTIGTTSAGETTGSTGSESTGTPGKCSENLVEQACIDAGCNPIHGFPMKQHDGMGCIEDLVFLGCVPGSLCDDGAIAVCMGDETFAVGCSNLIPDGFEWCPWPPDGLPMVECM
jgi:hypothetical protein